MPAPVIIDNLPQFDVLYNLPADVNTVVCIGGRGGAKSYEVSKFIAVSSTIRKKRCVVLRDEKEAIRESILAEILQRYDTADEYGHLSQEYERLDTGIKDKKTGELVVFTKGFRASDNKKKTNLKGVSNIDIAVIEEAEDIRDVDKFNTFADSIRKPGAVIIIILNTPDINHWVIKRYFNLEPAKDDKGEYIDGMFKIIPRKLKGFLCIQTNYTDNPKLDPVVAERYANYGNPESELYNPYYYHTSILGYASTGRKGQVIKHAKPIKREEYMDLAYTEIIGQDFGTASPAATIGVKLHRNKVYARLINYKPMPTLKIGKMYCELGFGLNDRIVADHEDSNAITLLKNGWKRDQLSEEDVRKYPALLRGFHIIECIKGPDSVRDGVRLLEGMELYIVEEDKEFWEEILNYIYAQDKNGNYTDDPIDDYNHAIDALRYVVQDQRGGKNTKWGYAV